MTTENECFSTISKDEPFADRNLPRHLGALACPFRQKPKPGYTHYGCNHPDYPLDPLFSYNGFCRPYSLIDQRGLNRLLENPFFAMPPLVSSQGEKCYRVYVDLSFINIQGSRVHNVQPGGRFETIEQAIEYAHDVAGGDYGHIWIAEEDHPALRKPVNLED